MRNMLLPLPYIALLLLSACAATPQSAPMNRSLNQQLKLQNQHLQQLDGQVTRLQADVQASHQEIGALKNEIAAIKMQQKATVPTGIMPPESQPAYNTKKINGQTATDIYLGAFSAYTKGNYSRAIKEFDVFLHRYPSNAYVPNAWFWQGQAYLAQQDLTNAQIAFGEVVQYPQSAKAPEAQLQLARIAARQQRPVRAQQLLRKLQQQYPDSKASHSIPPGLLQELN